MPRFYFSSGQSAETPAWLRQPIWLAEAVVIASVMGTMRLLPLRWSRGLGAGIGRLIGRLSPRVAKVRRNLSVVFPGSNAQHLDEITRASFRNVGIAISELATLERLWQKRDRHIEFRLLPGAVEPSPARRTIFVTAHIGAWQLTPLIAPYYSVTMPLIYAPEQNPYVDRLLTSLRRSFRSPLVSRDGGMRMLMRALGHGESVGLTVDTRPDSGELVPFFGENALTNTAPARLALRFDCDLVPVLAERLEGARYRVNLYPPLQSRLPSGTRDEQALDLSSQINTLFEHWIAARPEQWLCLKRRWPNPVYQRYA